jgi:hypothetical protein
MGWNPSAELPPPLLIPDLRLFLLAFLLREVLGLLGLSFVIELLQSLSTFSLLIWPSLTSSLSD